MYAGGGDSREQGGDAPFLILVHGREGVAVAALICQLVAEWLPDFDHLHEGREAGVHQVDAGDLSAEDEVVAIDLCVGGEMQGVREVGGRYRR